MSNSTGHGYPETGEYMSLSSVRICMFIIRSHWKCCVLCQAPRTLMVAAWGPYEAGNWKPLVVFFFFGGGQVDRWKNGVDIWLNGGGITFPLHSRSFIERRGERKTGTENEGAALASCFRIQPHSSRSLRSAYSNYLKYHTPPHPHHNILTWLSILVKISVHQFWCPFTWSTICHIWK